MQWFDCPLNDRDGELSSRIFEECISGFRKDNPCRQVASYKSCVKSASANYKTMIPTSIESYPPQNTIPEPDKNSFKKVYSQKFAKQGTPGRKHYDELMSAAPYGSCPVCGIHPVKTLDHYLPQSKFPLLAVTPTNLIPICSDCNGLAKKGDYCGKSFDKMLIHPYLDKEPDCIWLKATLQQFPSFRIRFESCYPDDEIMRSRFTTQLNVFHLDETYETNAMNQILGQKLFWAQLYKNQGRDSLLETLDSMRKSHEQQDLNSWISAMYRALIKQVDLLISYVTAK